MHDKAENEVRVRSEPAFSEAVAFPSSTIAVLFNNFKGIFYFSHGDVAK
jgi:hypothetical protein